MSNIADKIAKLIEKADSTTHPEEASTFMAKAHALLEQHGLSLLDVGRLQSDDPVGKTRKQAEFFASESCLRDVVFNLAIFYGCQAIIHPQGNHRWATIFGRESARITFSLMWPYVKKCVRAEARRLHKEQGSTYARQLRYVADALTYRLMVENAKRGEKRGTPETRGVNALVPLDLIEQEMEGYNATPARDRQQKITAAAMDAAENISLNMQTTGAKQKRLT